MVVLFALLSCGGGGSFVGDFDLDGVPDLTDNCDLVPNPDQTDKDGDNVGDVCDPMIDRDFDWVADKEDNCPDVPNQEQEDRDADTVGDACDNCLVEPNPDQTDFDEDGIGEACHCDSCDDNDWCVMHPHPEVANECRGNCPTSQQCAASRCCPLGSTCGPNGECIYADLFVDDKLVKRSMRRRTSFIRSDSCELYEGCVADTGDRDLLRFSLRTPNTGEGPMHLGDPANNPLFEYSDCHQHNHFSTYAHYELREVGGGKTVAHGHKQAFCLMDFEPWSAGAGRDVYHCQYQGISTGWADTYGWDLDCQFVDITGVPAGDYELFIALNTEGWLAESDYDNNVAVVPVSLQ